MMKEKEMKRVPKLRFPEFTDDWEQRKLGDIIPVVTDYVAAGSFADIAANVDYKSEPDYAQLVRTVDLKHNFENNDSVYVDKNAFDYLYRVNLDEESIVLPNIGANIGEVYYIEPSELPYERNVLGPNAIYLKPNKNTKFIYSLFQTVDFQKKLAISVASSGQPKFNKTELKEILLMLPNNDEQRAIGSYFRNLDNLITLHQRKLEKLKELRKGVMKKLFNQEVRFKADDESEFPEWEKKKIGDVFSQIKDKNKDGRNQNVITNSAEFGLINQRDFFDKDIAVDGKTENYTVIKTGDFVYNPRKSKQAPYGPFNCYQLEENGIVSPLYTCLRPKSNVNDKYLLWYFKSGSWHRFIYENGAQNGARHDRVGMTDSLMQEIPVYLPQAVEEQQKIADCLLSLDDVIAKQKATLVAWEELKKGLLQQMFV